MQLPIGSESDLKGVVDLVKMKGVVWQNEDLGAKFDYVDIPADLKEKAMKYRKDLETEDFIEAIPYRETSLYIKLIARNYLI